MGNKRIEIRINSSKRMVQNKVVRYMVTKGGTQSENTFIKVTQIVDDLVQQTESSFQSSTFKCGKVNKIQKVLITAVPRSGCPCKFLDTLQCSFVLYQVRGPDGRGIVEVGPDQREIELKQRITRCIVVKSSVEKAKDLPSLLAS